MDNLYFTIPLLIDDYDDKALLQKAISSAIMGHQNQFLPLLERLIDLGDSNMSVMEGSLNIESCDVDINLTTLEGFTSGMFDSFHYASCKDMQSQDEHEVSLPFTIENDALSFDLEIPPAWKPDDYE